MKKILHFIFILSLFLTSTQHVLSQEKKNELHVIYVKDLGAKDYYTLLEAKEEVLKFEIVEACIPKGLIAINYMNGYDENELLSYMQSIILKLTDKMASPTSYDLEDLRQACAAFRKELDE